MSDKPTRRSVLKTSLAAAAAVTVSGAMAEEVTVKELSKGLSKPLTPANEKLADAALADTKQTSAQRLSHKLPENSEPSFVFQVRPGATKKW